MVKIATPGHELYGGHLSQDVIDSMIAPRDNSSELVMEWLKSEGLSGHATISTRSDSVIIEASIRQIEKLLDAEYSAYGMSFSPLIDFLFAPLTYRQYGPNRESMLSELLNTVFRMFLKVTSA